MKKKFPPHLKCQKYLALNLFLDEVILAFVIEDDMDFFGAVATDIRTWEKLIELLHVILTNPVIVIIH